MSDVQWTCGTGHYELILVHRQLGAVPPRIATREGVPAMAYNGLGPDELKHLELLRVRLQQLTNSLGSMRSSIVMANPLPSP